MAEVAAPPFRIRSLGWSVYVPTFLFAVGQGAVIPFTPLLARNLGASVALASLVVALRGVGMMIFDVPAGILVGAVGERNAMAIGSVILAITGIGATLCRTPWQFAGLMFVMGFAWSIWQLARLAYVSEQAPPEMRGRALSLVGGTNRIGNFVGPFIAALMSVPFGIGSVFILQALVALVAAGMMFVMIQGGTDRYETAGHGNASQRFLGVVREHRNVFQTAGTVTICLSVIRSSRQAIIPLWGDHIGLNAAAVASIFGLSSGMDMLLFYPTGYVMDRFGRRWVGIPCLVVLAFGLMLVPLAHTLVAFALVAIVTGFGNGLGAGINMTLGADFSPPDRRAEFLGVWRLIGDIGQFGGPLVLSVLTGVATLGTASVATGGIGLLGAALMFLTVPETLQRRPRVAPPLEAPPSPG
jgi:MFS family permease